MGVDMDGGSELVVAAEHDDAAPGHSKGEEYLAGSAPPYLEVILETLETLEILRLLRLLRLTRSKVTSPQSSKSNHHFIGHTKKNPLCMLN